MKAKGRLAHYFHGDYSAGIILAFDSPEDATAALAMLGTFGFTVHPAEPKALYARVPSDVLSRFETTQARRIAITPCGWKHCKDKCANAGIANLRHSVDFGASFTWDSEERPIEKPKRARKRKAPSTQETLSGFLDEHVIVKVVK